MSTIHNDSHPSWAKLVVLSIISAGVIIVAIIALTSNKPLRPISSALPSGTQAILYVGDGCPHCAKVEEYITEHGVAQKVSLETKEVWHSQQNAAELGARAKSCGITSDSIGIPFLWDGARCYVGDTDVIAYLASTTASKK